MSVSIRFAQHSPPTRAPRANRLDLTHLALLRTSQLVPLLALNLRDPSRLCERRGAVEVGMRRECSTLAEYDPIPHTLLHFPTESGLGETQASI